MNSTLEKYYPQVLSIVRIVVALTFLCHGLMKIVHFPAPQPGVENPLPTLIFIAGLIEIVGGSLLTVGLFTRAAAFICSGEMAFAYFMGHASKSFYPALNGGDSSVLYCFIFLLLTFTGGGAIALDAIMGRRLPVPATA